MRNVVKGFQFAGMAVPKMHALKVNNSFSAMHTARAPKAPSGRLIRPPLRMPAPTAKRPGKNVGIKGGYKV
jgi:hypothetical protein